MLKSGDARQQAAGPRDRWLRRLTARDSLIVGACVLAAGEFAAYYSARVITWAVMTDELQTTKLATSIAETGSLVPRIHGHYYAALSQLYPLLLAPFYGLLTAPAAATAAHVLNPFLLASAAWPAYLLARSVTGSRAAAAVAALLTAFTPWLVLSTTLLTENAAYPAFVWALFVCYRAIAEPSVKRDLGALAVLLLAFVARTQFLVLALALPFSILGHELTFTALGSGGKTRSSRLRSGAKRAFASHPVLFSVYAAAGLAAAGLAAIGSLGTVVGNYAVPFSGDLLPPGILHSAAAYLDYVVIGGVILPFLLASSWVLTIEVASFGLRFSPEGFIQDRYLFYLTPLFAVGTGAALVQRTHTRARGVVAIAAGAAFAWLAGVASYADHVSIFWAAPASAFHPAIVAAAAWLHLSSDWFIRALVLVLALVAAVFVTLPRLTCPSVALATAMVIAAFGGFEAGYVFERFAEPALTRTNRFQQDRRDWIDAAVPFGSSVALVPSPLESSIYWWEAEYWNKDVERVLRVEDGPTFTPFPVAEVSVDVRAGRLLGAQPSDFLVVAPRETRFHLVEAGARRADVTPLRLVRVTKGYRLVWSTRGVSADAWTTPAEDARLRFYGNGHRVKRALVVVLSAAREADGRVLALHFDSIEAPAVGTCRSA